MIPFVFVISGKAQSGKDTAGDIILNHLKKSNKKAVRLMYAKYIKMYATDYFDWDGREETKPRDLLQMLGTDIRQKLNKPKFFINRTKEDIEILSNFFDYFIITDARTIEEVTMPKESFKSISININRNEENNLNIKQKKNYTETALDGYENFDYIINNNGTLEDLEKNILSILEEVL